MPTTSPATTVSILGYTRVDTLRLPVPDPSPSSDAALVLEAQAEPQRFEELYERYFDRVFRFFASRTSSPDQAEDLTAQTFLKAFEHLHGYRPSAPFAAWLFRIARNLLIDAYRVSGRTTRLSEDLPLPYDADIPGQTERTLQQEAIARCLDQLSPVEREVLALRVDAELSHAEIAAALGKNEAAVKVAFSRAVQRLRTLLSTSDA